MEPKEITTVRLKDPNTGKFIPKDPNQPVKKVVSKAQAVAKFHETFDDAVSPSIWQEMIDAQVKKALNGNTNAFKVLTEVRFGKAARMTSEQTGGMKAFADILQQVMASKPVENVIEVVERNSDSDDDTRAGIDSVSSDKLTDSGETMVPRTQE